MNDFIEPGCNNQFKTLSAHLISCYTSLIEVWLKQWVCINNICRLDRFVVRVGIFPEVEPIREHHKKVWSIRKGAMSKDIAA
jgi:hypothetical protein